jgi:hypothetical protein
MSTLPEYDAIFLHNDFQNGVSNSPFSVDLLQLKPAELEALYEWMDNILNKKEHRGKNKPSFQIHRTNRSPGRLPNCYLAMGAWHYHSGPTYQKWNDPKIFTEWNLPHNDNGQASNEIIHYSCKQIHGPSLVSITVFGFSRVHDYFQPGDEFNNPYRAKSLQLTANNTTQV